MEVTLESLANNPFVTVGSFALAVLGIVLAIIFYVRSKRDKTPCFEKSSNTIIEGLHQSLDGLEVHYKGKAQERITVTKVAFWNDGKETIDRSDLIEKDPLRLVCPKTVDVLDIQIVNSSAESNSAQIGEPVSGEDTVYYPLSFEYLDHEEFFVVQIIHNGDSSEEFDVEGKVKGVKHIEHVTGARIPSKTLSFLPFMGSVEVLMSSPLFMKYFGSLMYLSFALFAIWNLLIGNTEWYVWLGAGVCILFAGVMFYGFRHIAPVKI